MHKQSHKIISVCLESKKHSNAHIIYAALHCAVHSLGVPGIILLWPCRVQRLVVRLVVCLLKKYICTNAGVAQTAVVLDSGCRNVHIHAADSTVLVLYAVDGIYALEYILDGVHERVLACLKRKALMSHILQGNDLGTNFLLSEFLAAYALVFCVIRTIYATVDAVVREIKRCEHNYAVAIETVFYLIGKSIDLLHHSGIVALQQHRSLAVCQSLEGTCLVEYALCKRNIGAILARILHCGAYLAVTNEFGCYC